ncbi:MAG: hypothetical protein AAGA90_02195 [Actinomycetota bacterium]
MTTPIEAQLRGYFADLEADAVARGCRPRPDDRVAAVTQLVLDPLAASGDERPPPGRALWLGGAAAAVIALIVALVVFGGDSATEVDSAADQALTEQVTPDVPVEETEALALVGRWNTAVRVGDLDTLEELFPSGESEFENVDRKTQLQLAAWDVAQGSANTEPTCAVQPDETDRSVVIRCEYENLQPVRELVGAGAIRVAETFRVESGVIASINQTWLDDWMTVDDAFVAWHVAAGGDEADIVYRTWDSVEEASVAGERRTEVAQAWAAWLTEQGCRWDEPCAAIEE